jgi:prevent-host-death family protein
MERTMSATEARVRFGEMMKRVTEQDETIIVERDGIPRMVVLSLDAYERMKGGTSAWDDWEAQLAEFHTELKARLDDQVLPSSVDIIRAMRAERDEQLLSLR